VVGNFTYAHGNFSLGIGLVVDYERTRLRDEDERRVRLFHFNSLSSFDERRLVSVSPRSLLRVERTAVDEYDALLATRLEYEAPHHLAYVEHHKNVERVWALKDVAAVRALDDKLVLFAVEHVRTHVLVAEALVETWKRRERLVVDGDGARPAIVGLVSDFLNEYIDASGTEQLAALAGGYARCCPERRCELLAYLLHTALEPVECVVDALEAVCSSSRGDDDDNEVKFLNNIVEYKAWVHAFGYIAPPRKDTFAVSVLDSVHAHRVADRWTRAQSARALRVLARAANTEELRVRALALADAHSVAEADVARANRRE
jgi:hypothetical protein